MHGSASCVGDLIHFSCLSDICRLLEKATGLEDPIDVAKLLISEISKANFSEKIYLHAVHQIDDAFPTAILRDAYKISIDRLKSVSTYEDDIFAALQMRNCVKNAVNEPVYSLTEVGERLKALHNKDFSESPSLNASQYEPSSSMLFNSKQLKSSRASSEKDLLLKTHSQEVSAADLEIKNKPPLFLIKHQRALSTGVNFSVSSEKLLSSKYKIGSVSQAIDQQRAAYSEKKECLRGRIDSKYNERVCPRVRDSASKQAPSVAVSAHDRQKLKIFQVKDELLHTLSRVQVLIVIGETGSGKSSQIPQYLVENGYTDGGKIVGVTQPRRLPAKGIAERVAGEVGCSVGEEVGYTMRFEDKTSRRTVIRYMTDGILLREALFDPFFTKYSVIIIDEAHERNINTDLLLGLLKRAMISKNFKLIVTSATLNVEKFSQFFYDAEVFFIEGRTYPVTISYISRPMQGEYVYEAAKKAMECHLTELPGDILVFLPGKEEIEDAAERTLRWGSMLPSNFPKIQVHTVYAALPTEVQAQVFFPAPWNTRKIIFSTNVAETSITIDGVRYVIDPGVFKQSFFRPKTGMDVLSVCPISQAQANQRAGRAGRTAPGKCFRLYTQDAFTHELLAEAIPEIQRCNLANILLLMKATGVHDVLSFEFIDRPQHSNLVHALHQLFVLGALDDEGLLTFCGRKMSEYPIDPSMSRTLIASFELGCVQEVITVLAILSVSEEVYFRPRHDTHKADSARLKLQHSDGDHMTLLSIYQQWHKENCSKGWCDENFLNYRALMNANKIREELSNMVIKEPEVVPKIEISSLSLSIRLRLAFLSGYFYNVAKRVDEGYEVYASKEKAFIFPSSAIYGKEPPLVMYQSIMMTSREFMRIVSPISPSWLIFVAPQYFVKKSQYQHNSHSQSQEALEPLFNKHLGPDQWRFSNFYNKRAKR